MNASDVIVIYPGRFHPFHKGHKGVYDLLNSKFKNVYIATSDKVEADKSPFSFDEKVKIMNLTGVETSNILKVKQTYNGNEYIGRFNNNYGLIFAVSEKDMLDDPRFNFPASGMSLKKNGEPAYLQKFTSMDKLDDMTKHGYIMTVPTTTFKVNGHDVNSASQIRTMLGSENIDDAKQAFVDLYDKYNETVFNMIRNKLGNKTMENIDINELRKLAGLEERDIDQDDDYSDVPGFREKPMFDQLGKIIDSYEMSQDGDDIKNPLSTVKTDDGEEMEVSVGEAKALKDMMEMLSSARQGEEKSAREKFLDSIQKSEGLHSMLEFARSKGLVKEGEVEEGNAFAKKVRDLKAQGKKKGEKFELDGEEYALEDLNLDDIREDFDVRPNCHSKTHDCATLVIHPKWGEGKPVYESHAMPTDEGYVAWYDVEFDHGIEREVPTEDMKIIKLAEHGMNASIRSKSDKKILKAGRLKDIIIDAMQMTKEEFDMEYKGEFDYDEINADFGDDSGDQEPAELESFDPQAEQGREEEAYEDLMNALDTGGEEAYAKACGLSHEELDSEMTDISIEKGLHMDDDRDEIIHLHAEETCANADYKDHGEPAVDEDLERMKHLAGIDNITEVDWNWQSGSYDEKAGYDNNYSVWRDEAMRDRSNYGDEPFKSEEEMIKSFEDSMESMGIDIFKQKQISLAKKQEQEKEERERYSRKPEQKVLDF